MLSITSASSFFTSSVLASSFALSSFFGMCDCDDGAGTKQEQNVTIDVKITNEAGTEPTKVISQAADAETEIGVGDIGGKVKVHGQSTIIVIGEQPKQFTPFPSFLAQIPQRVPPQQIPMFLHWYSERVRIPQMDGTTLALLNTSPAPLTMSVAIPDAKKGDVSAFGIRFFDQNGVKINIPGLHLAEANQAEYVYDAPKPGAVIHAFWFATIKVLKADGSYLMPQDLGLDQHDVQFQMFIRASNLNSDWVFGYRSSLWRDQGDILNGGVNNHGIDLGWHYQKMDETTSLYRQAQITNVQDSNGDGLFSAGEDIYVTVVSGNSSAAKVRIGVNLQELTVLSVTPSGGTANTYRVTIPAATPPGPTTVLFQNIGATPKTDLANVGVDYPSVDTVPLTIQ